MKTTITLAAVTVLLFIGCGQLEDTESGTIEYENVNYDPAKNNTCFSNRENSAGCFGDDQYFGEHRVYEGFWSIYGKSDNYKNYYDKYLYGYDFQSDGTLKKRETTQNYYYSPLQVWGVNTDGSELTIDPGVTYKIVSRFTNDCYKVNVAEKEYKICHEESVDTTQKNASGYYGETIAFGNYDYGRYTVAGSWSIDGVSVELTASGKTSNGGEWGVSEDGKLLFIDDNAYLAYRYPDNGCIETFLMRGDFALDKKMLCKD